MHGFGDNMSIESLKAERKQEQMLSGPLPTLQFCEFYLIKSIKVGNGFKDFG